MLKYVFTILLFIFVSQSTLVFADDHGDLISGVINAISIDDNGNEVPLGTEGSRQVNAILGNPEPDFVMNYINSINYKNFTLGFHFQHVSGGDMYSSTIGVLLGRLKVFSQKVRT